MNENVVPIVAERMCKKPEQVFYPASFAIVDESRLHAGHNGHDESHLAVMMNAAFYPEYPASSVNAWCMRY